MNRITHGLPAALNSQGSLPSAPPSRIVPFPVSSMAAKPLNPERLSLGDALALYFTSLYELNKLVILAVHSFFESLFTGGASSNSTPPALVQKAPLLPSTPRPSVIVPFEAPQSVEPVETISTAKPVVVSRVVDQPESTPEDELDERLYQVFPSLLQYEEDQMLPIVLSRYFTTHLFKGRESVAFDRETNVFTLTFPAQREVPMILGGGIKKRLGNQLKDPKFCLAQTVKIRVADGKMEFLNDSLTISCKFKPSVFIPEIDIAATIQSIADPQPFEGAGVLEASIKLGDDMNPIVRGAANGLCALLDQDLKKVKLWRDQSIQLLHQALYPQA